jgi:hypothetical protein
MGEQGQNGTSLVLLPVSPTNTRQQRTRAWEKASGQGVRGAGMSMASSGDSSVGTADGPRDGHGFHHSGSNPTLPPVLCRERM